MHVKANCMSSSLFLYIYVHLLCINTYMRTYYRNLISVSSLYFTVYMFCSPHSVNYSFVDILLSPPSLGPTGRALSPGKHSMGSLMSQQMTSSSQHPSAGSSPVSPASGSVLQYTARPVVAADRSSINSILNLLGAWLFEASLSHIGISRRPGQ